MAKYLSPLAKNDHTIRDTLSFPDLPKRAPSDDSYDGVSYDVKAYSQVYRFKRLLIIFSTKFTSKKS